MSHHITPTLITHRRWFGDDLQIAPFAFNVTHYWVADVSTPYTRAVCDEFGTLVPVPMTSALLDRCDYGHGRARPDKGGRV